MRAFLLGMGLIALGVMIACTPQREKDPTTLNIYYLNDLHGHLEAGDNAMGMASIGNFLIDEKTNNPERTLIFGGGDMVQGTLISNHDYGETTTEIMDSVGFDATVVGNHEFDWGLSTLTRYYTGARDAYQADHDLLGANVFYKGSETIPQGIEPYALYTRGEITVGVIGAIGYGQESSIMASMVEDYTFADPVPIVREHARTLRQEKGADVVVLASHDGLDTYNDTYARLSRAQDDGRIDAIFAGHSHRAQTRLVEGRVPALIAGANGSHVGHMELTLEAGELSDISMRTLTRFDDERLRHEHPDITRRIEEAKEPMEDVFESTLESGDDYSQWALTRWMAHLMMETTGADIGYQNTGGTRDSFHAGEALSPARLYDVFPFDNNVVTATVSGEVALDMIGSNPYAADIPGDIDKDETYKVATNAYVFHSPYNALEAGESINHKPFSLYDLAAHKYSVLEEQGEPFTARNTPSVEHYTQWWSD